MMDLFRPNRKALGPLVLGVCGLMLTSCVSGVEPVPLSEEMDPALFDPSFGPVVSDLDKEYYSEARKAYHAGNFSKAKRMFEELAEDGYGDAAYELGKLYKYGKGVEQDPVLAGEWLKAAVTRSNGHRAQAAYHLGDLLSDGEGILLQPEKAARLLKFANEDGIAYAAVPLGVMYIKGNGVPRDPKRGREMIIQAANQKIISAQYWLLEAYSSGGLFGENHGKAEVWADRVIPLLRTKVEDENSTSAMNKLAEIYELGLGRPVDNGRALQWYRRAAEAGRPDYLAYFARDLIRRPNASEGMRAKGYDLLRNLAEEYEHPYSQMLLGVAYLRGTGVEQDTEKAERWLKQAAEHDLPKAMLAYGRLLIEQPNTSEELAKAAELFEGASDAGNPYAMRELGELHLYQAFPDASPEKGIELLAESYKGGAHSAAAKIGRAYLDGEGVERNPELAIEWLERAIRDGDEHARLTYARAIVKDELPGNVDAARREVERFAKKDNSLAMMTLARVYRDGDTVPQDLDRSRYWFRKAAEADVDDAEDSLASVIYRYATRKEEAINVEELQRAAKMGHAGALSKLGREYLIGDQLPKKTEHGVQMLEQAAAQDHYGAMATLGEALLLGRFGVPQDIPRGHKLLEQAAGTGNLKAERTLGNALLLGEQIPQDTERGLAMLQKAAATNDTYAMNLLGTAYLTGRGGIDVNADAAEKWLLRAADSGDLNAYTKLGKAYLAGNSLERNPDKAVKFLEAAADKGDASAQLAIGRALVQGEGVEQDVDRGIAYLQRGVAQGHVGSMATLGRVYISDRYGREDIRKGAEYLYRAAKAGHKTATVSLAKAYLKANGVESANADYATLWLRDVLESNSEVAIRTLTEILQEGAS